MILYPEVQAKVHQSLDSAFKMDENVSYCDKERLVIRNALQIFSRTQATHTFC